MPPRKKKTEDATPVRTHQHADHQRPVIPDAGVTSGDMPKAKRQSYAYSPHLDPVLRSDPSGAADLVAGIVAKVEGGLALNDEEKRILRSIARAYEQPWVEWAGKSEAEIKKSLKVDDVYLHIHERISAQAIINAVRRDDDKQADFFAKNKPEKDKQVQYYRHSMGWTNRLILGDSLQVMHSLAGNETLAGQVQMVYIDPPYGIEFSGNWQNEVGKLDVKRRDEDLTREPEMIKAYRDTWNLRVHSYLKYLKDRIKIAHSLLADSGSIFVQISDENLHLVTNILDEVFGSDNKISVIPFRKKTMPFGTNYVEQMADFIVWYGKNKYDSKGRKGTKYNKLYREMNYSADSGFPLVRLKNGRIISAQEARRLGLEGDLAGMKSMEPSGRMESGMFTPSVFGQTFQHPKNGYGCDETSMIRLAKAGRVLPAGNLLRYVLLANDKGLGDLTVPWSDTAGADGKRYVVQTNTEVIKRCMLMATDPGDLVIDPTCGSGTTAFVAEQWGRRWITIDTSRVAVAVARQRLLVGSYDAFEAKDPNAGHNPDAPINPSYGFNYRKMPHVTLRSIAQNERIDVIFEAHAAAVSAALSELNGAMKRVEKKHIDWKEYGVPLELAYEDASVVDAHKAFFTQLEKRTAAVDVCVMQASGEVDLLDQPKVIRRCVRVSGPFSVEGVRPEELVLGEDGRVFDSTVNEEDGASATNVSTYIDRMVSLLKMDGVTFLGNRPMKFGALERAQVDGLHALGAYNGTEPGELPIAVAFGPQYGPVNAIMAARAIEAARAQPGVKELIIAGFSFDAAAQQRAHEASAAGMQVNIAHIRPDVSPGMDGLLKDQRNSQLFTVFGQPEFKAKSVGAGAYQVELGGVCVYNPLTGMVESSNATKVAAWFLDADYDGQCFCVSQAFFPDSKAWEKIAKALGSKEDEATFETFAGTTSLAFKLGQHRRVAIKVIDPRGNEVMGIKTIA